MDLVSIGLIVIGLAWIAQLIMSWNGNNKIQPTFILLYLLGVLLMLIAGYTGNMGVSPYEVVTFIAALIVLIRLGFSKKKRK